MSARCRDWLGDRRIKVFWAGGSFRFTRVVLNPDFRETKFVIVDVGGSKDVVVSGERPREHRKSRHISFLMGMET